MELQRHRASGLWAFLPDLTLRTSAPSSRDPRLERNPEAMQADQPGQSTSLGGVLVAIARAWILSKIRANHSPLSSCHARVPVRRRQKRRDAKAELREFCAERQAGLLGICRATSRRHPGLRQATSRSLARNAACAPLHKTTWMWFIRRSASLTLRRWTCSAWPRRLSVRGPYGLTAPKTLGRRFRAEAQQQQSNPHLPLKGFGAGCFALPDLQQRLPARECHVIVNGKVLTGPVAVLALTSHATWRPGNLASSPSTIFNRHALRARQLHHLQLSWPGGDQPSWRGLRRGRTLHFLRPRLAPSGSQHPDGQGDKVLRSAEKFAIKRLRTMSTFAGDWTRHR